MTSKTIPLAGGEIKVEYSGGANAWLRNDGTAAVYASAAPGVTAGADGVVSIPAGQAAAIYGASGTVYLLGTGSVLLVGSDYTSCPFKTSAQSGGSGADEVARAAIEAHAGNTAVHVTAEEKAAWNGKADKSYVDSGLAGKADKGDVPTKVSDLVNDSGFIASADGGSADNVNSANHKARLYEDPEGGNLRLESPDGSMSMEMDMYDNKSLRMYFEKNGELVFPFLYNSIYNNFEIPKLNGARITSVGARRGYTTSAMADVITYGERVVHKQSSDASYIGWTTTADGWFAPIFVSKTVEGTRYAMNGNECVYSVGGEKCGSFSHNGETYYACWNNPASLMSTAVSTSALYVALSGEDYVFTCKKLIDICEGLYADSGNADTLDGKHADDLYYSHYPTETDANNCVANGNYMLMPSAANLPISAYTLIVADISADGTWLMQRAVNVNNLSMYYMRVKVNGVWSAWHVIADGGNAASVGAYTEAKIAALEARIAALEGGN